MSKQRLLELAERVERLSGPDREVDRLIALACLDYTEDHHYPNGIVNDRGHVCFDYPNFTASLDASMELVPEGFYWDVAKLCSANNGLYWASCYNNAMLPEMTDSDPGLPGTTPALALTAASLRAKAAMIEDHKPVSKRLATVLRIQDEVNFEAGRPQYRDYLIEHDIERGRQGR